MTARAPCVLLLLVSACLADEGDAWIPTEIDESQLLQKAGEQGLKLVCNSFENSVHRLYRSPLLVKAACTAHALQQAGNAEECAVLADQCMGTLPPVVDEQLERVMSQAGCGAIGADRKECTSTVSELIACLGDLGDAVAGLKLEATCAVFGSPVPADWWKVAPPVSCVDVFSRCKRPEPR